MEEKEKENSDEKNSRNKRTWKEKTEKGGRKARRQEGTTATGEHLRERQTGKGNRKEEIVCKMKSKARYGEAATAGNR